MTEEELKENINADIVCLIRKPLLEKILKLEAQIERMMCCANCKHHKKNELIRVGNDVLCHKNKKCDYWELGE